MNVALLLSGGTGTRLGADIPKQYIEVKGMPVLAYCLRTFLELKQIDVVQIVAEEKWQNYIRKACFKYDIKQKIKGFSNPGENRQLSIWNGLNDIRKYAAGNSVIIVHDAARPGVSSQLLEEGLRAIEGHDGVLPVLPMKDTTYLSKDGTHIDSLLDRSQLFAGQAPEFFYLEQYYQANKNLLPEKIYSINGSTEPAILQGLDVAMIPGEERNFKITTREDLMRFQRMTGEV